MRLVSLFILLGLLTGCATAASSYSSQIYREETTLFGEGRAYMMQEDIREIHLQNFFRLHPHWTERDKIDYLLTTIKNSGVTFVRNGRSYSSEQASQWLRWKMGHRQYARNPIDSAAEFVERVCERSNKTGIPYEVVFRNGHRAPAQQVINQELKSLEKALAVHSL